MRHVFVESNWVFSYCAPGHHKRQDAVELLARAAKADVQLHLPAICLTEARQAILTKCQPRNEADALRQFLLRARAEALVTAPNEQATRVVLDQFERQVRAELRALDDTLASLHSRNGIEVFPLNDRMLEKAVALTALDLSLKPFDQAILAAVLARVAELTQAGENEFCFCELDADLQPWDKKNNPKQPLADLYDRASIWVYGDFEMISPEMPEGWAHGSTDCDLRKESP